MTQITHDQLVKTARVFLQKKCRVIVTEMPTSNVGETPDAIGWSGFGRCIVVECKVTRADFLANKNKCHERAGLAMGDERWFLTPPGLISADEVPKGWGLLERRPSGHKNGYFIRKVVPAPQREKNEAAREEERRMLIAMTGRALEGLHRVRPLALGEEGEAGEEVEK
jgi:hypothetical protein